MKRIAIIALMVMLTGSMLAGCGSSKPQAAAAQGQPANGVEGHQANGGGTRQTRPAADMIGKVVSVKEGKLTINKSTMDPSAMQSGRGGGGRGRGSAPQGGQSAGGTQGNTPQGGQSAGSGTLGNAPQGGQSGNVSRGGFGRAMEFSTETVSYSVTDQTKVTTLSFGDKGRQIKEETISQLKAGEIIMIWLTDDKSGIASIQLMPSGGFGGSRGGTAGGGSGPAGGGSGTNQ